MGLTVAEASGVLREAVRERIRTRSLLYLIQGGLLVLTGALAVVFPVFFGPGVMVLIGWLLVIAGLVQILGLIGASRIPFFWMQLISVMLSLVVGGLLISRPETGTGSLALLMLVFFVAEGMARIAFAMMIRPMEDWLWILGSGVAGILMALVLAANLPDVGVWLLGLLLGITLIAIGGAQGYMAWNLRREA